VTARRIFADAVELSGSVRPAVNADRIRRSRRKERVELSFYLRRRESAFDVTDIELGTPAFKPVDHNALATERAARHADDITLIEAWAAMVGLAVTRRDPMRRLVKVAGSVEQIEHALGASIADYRADNQRFRGRAGPIFVPSALAEVVEGIFGIDTRPAAESQLVPFSAMGLSSGHLPTEFARLYDFPITPGLGTGQTIALLEFGGGYSDNDLNLAFAAMGVPKPLIVSEGVSGGFPDYGADSRADREVALNIQIAGGLAPGANIVVYFARNNGQGWVDAVSRAIHDVHHRPSIISISWAAPEDIWETQFSAHRKVLSQLFREAAQLGITILTASGNFGATWRSPAQRAIVSYPASDPFVCGCGGTSLQNGPAGQLVERVWNTPDGISGGGISGLFLPPPPYQANAAVPGHANGGPPGRGVPDVAGVADRSDGYRLILYGQPTVADGTSAVAPLWAALIARLNEAKGRNAGFFLPRLYASPSALNDVRLGDNAVSGTGYTAGAGWDPCTGLGSPDGQKLLHIL